MSAGKNKSDTSRLADGLQQGLEAFEIDDSILLYFDQFGDEGREALLAIAQDPKHDPPGHRGRAVFVLGELAWRPAFKTMVGLLDDVSASVRLHAIHACARIGGPEAVQPLLKIATDEQRPLTERVHALRPLAQIGEEDLIDHLAEWQCEELPPELGRQLHDTLASLRRALPDKRC
jgi:HEAT repeat protein